MANIQSGYTPPVVVPLRGGLDTVSSRFSVTPGTLQDCLNYETYSVEGYSVMGGIQRYDGSYPCYSRDWLIAIRTTGAGNFTPGEYLKNGENLFGVCIYWDTASGILNYLISDIVYAPKSTETITGVTSAATLVAGPLGIKQASKYFPDMKSFLDKQAIISGFARSDKKSIFPNISYAKNIIPHGLHWFNGYLYAVVDHYKIKFDLGGTTELSPGDTITCGAAGTLRTAVILDIKVDTGSWSTTTAAGYMLVRISTPAANTFSVLGNINLIRPNGAAAVTTTNNVARLLDFQLSDPAWGAGIYRSLADNDVIPASGVVAGNKALSIPAKRWEPLDMGWEIPIKTDATTTGPAIAPQVRDGKLSTLVDGLSTPYASPVLTFYPGTPPRGDDTHPFGPGSDSQPGPAQLHTTLGDGSDLTYVVFNTTAATAPTYSDNAIIGFNGFSLPADAIPTGIQIKVRAAPTTVNTNGAITVQLDGAVVYKYIASPPTREAAVDPSSILPKDIIIGGASDLWGLEGLTTQQIIEVISIGSGIALKLGMTDKGNSPANQINLYEVSMTLFYKGLVTQYFAFDPVSGQDIALTIPYYKLFKGTFNPGAGDPGEGVIAAYNLTPLSTIGGGTKNTTLASIRTNWQLRTARSPDGVNGGGSLVALFSGDMKSQMLPCRRVMANARCQYEFISANFYSNSEWKAIYGASGQSAAFTYDGYYFYKFYTELPKTEDTPKHLVYHRNYMCLGYDNGQLLVSLPGEPTNFDSVVGSTSYPVGERITNLLSLKGTALAIFTENKIDTLNGTVLISTNSNDAVMQTISPYSGAIEYTAVDCGIPMFVDHRGVSTIETTDKYGDFDNGRISFLVSSIIEPRVNDQFSYQATNSNVMFCRAVKSKNQYRIYFADGTILTCSLPTSTRGYEFTKQKYLFNDLSDCLVPVAICTGTSKQGRDLIFGSFKILPNDTASAATPNASYREMFVYALDAGLSFDDSPIRHFCQINFTTLGTPLDFSLVRNITFQILGYNYFNETLRMSGDYQPFNTVSLPMIVDPSGKPTTTIKSPFFILEKPYGRGVTIAIEVAGEHKGPGHVLQGLIFESASGRTSQGNSTFQQLT